MFNIWLDYPSRAQEIDIVKNTTVNLDIELRKVMNAAEIVAFQNLIRKVPVPDNVYAFAVGLSAMSRPGYPDAHKMASEYLAWGAGPRSSQFLILGAKCNAAMNGKFAPDIEDVKSVAVPVMRHRLVRNYKAEAEGIRTEDIIETLMKA